MISYFFTAIVGTAMVVAVPAVGKEFSTNIGGLTWVLNSYILISAVLLLPIGQLVNKYGHAFGFNFGVYSFCITTLLCGISWSLESLIFFRCLQGIAASFLYCSGMALVSSHFPPETRGKALGAVTFMVYGGLSLGPVFGGFINSIYGWRAIFIACGLFCLVSCVVLALSGRIKNDKHDEEIDIRGVVLYVAATSLIFYGISRPFNIAIILVGSGIILFGGFMALQKRLAAPLLDLTLFSENKVFLFANLSSFLNYAATSAILYMVSLELHQVYHFDSRYAGLIMLSQPMLMAIFAPVSGVLADRIRPQYVATVGMGIVSIMLLSMVFSTGEGGSLRLIFTLAVLGIGFGLFSPANNTIIMNSLKKHQYAIGASILSTMRLYGQTISVSLAGIIIMKFGGAVALDKMNEIDLVSGISSSYIVFTILCFIGIFFSLVGVHNSRK